ncbi:DUF1214 domain-containing protein [Rhizobium sp. YIM 134829]|uniref:DUF1214 domain-containing protein n=1 Tax=Rhizobium sp. YIM 134829 TaxID=3390453 RepID=UPI00397C19E2
MFRVPILVALVLAIAFGGGIGGTIMALQATIGFGAVRLGPWTAFPDAQTAETDPYAKAHRARAGRLLYGRAEGMRFVAATDGEGKLLQGGCTYVIAGRTPPARFWTLFATDSRDTPLSDAPGRPTALNAWTVLRASDSSFTITVSPEAQPGNWMAVAHRGPVRLVLTLLDAPTANSSGATELVMPTITRGDCVDG